MIPGIWYLVKKNFKKAGKRLITDGSFERRYFLDKRMNYPSAAVIILDGLRCGFFWVLAEDTDGRRRPHPTEYSNWLAFGTKPEKTPRMWPLLSCSR
jgi:hypothetical protein